jgi:hypothetical protein
MLSHTTRVARLRTPTSPTPLAPFTLALCLACAGRSADPPRTDDAVGGSANESPVANGGTDTNTDPALPAGPVITDPGEPPGMGGASPTPSVQICQQSLTTASASPPSVLVLADRSGSMFDVLQPSGVSSRWFELRAAALAVVQALAPEVRFGFAAFAGSAETCPRIESVAFQLNNYAAIQALYGVLESSPELRDSGTLGALRQAPYLLADAPGDQFIWLLTDGESDYCKDGNPLCPVDSVVGELQALASATPPVRTLVSGIPAYSPAGPGALQAIADAGWGQPVELTAGSPGMPDINAIYDECNGDADWVEHFAATGKPNLRGQTIGAYASSSGGTPVHSPLEQDAATLIQQIRSAVLAERPCAFDLALEGVTLDALGTLDENARLEIDDTAVPYDAENGWHRVGASGVAIAGDACAALREAAAAPSIRLSWSCDA